MQIGKTINIKKPSAALFTLEWFAVRRFTHLQYIAKRVTLTPARFEELAEKILHNTPSARLFAELRARGEVR